MCQPTRRIKGLGKIALRVAELDAMQRFYQEVVGLELLRPFDHAAFFRIADGHGATRRSWPSSTARVRQTTGTGPGADNGGSSGLRDR